MTRHEEEYIRHIYSKIEFKDRKIKIKEIADDFNYSKQSVIEMIKKLKARGYVSYIPYKGVSLSIEGRKIGARITRVHRLWELFLVRELDMSWDEIDKEAQLLQHATSELLEEKLYNYLGRPDYCPHGDPIPDENGKIPKKEYNTLAEAKLGDTFVIHKVKDDPALLKYLEDKGIKIGIQLVIQSILEYDGMIYALKGDQELIISGESTKSIYGIIN